MTTEDSNNHKDVNDYKSDYKKRLFERTNKKFEEFNKSKKDEKIEIKPSGIFQKAKSFLDAVSSKGISGKKCSEETKKLRINSCHGNEDMGPCSERRKSERYEDSYFCGACGCGDKKGTQLVNISINGEPQYSKLDYPKVSCPLKMPGFTDYVPSEDGVSENNRKKQIESRYGIEYIKQQSNP